jgi:hypothetical protein
MREPRWFVTLASAICLNFTLTACDQRPPPDIASTASAPELTTASKAPLALPADGLDDETIANYLHAAMDYKLRIPANVITHFGGS